MAYKQVTKQDSFLVNMTSHLIALFIVSAVHDLCQIIKLLGLLTVAILKLFLWIIAKIVQRKKHCSDLCNNEVKS